MFIGKGKARGLREHDRVATMMNEKNNYNRADQKEDRDRIFQGGKILNVFLI